MVLFAPHLGLTLWGSQAVQSLLGHGDLWGCPTSHLRKARQPYILLQTYSPLGIVSRE